MEKREREKARSISRNSKFVLGSSHDNLKKLIEKREKELSQLISEHNANLKTQFVEERRKSRRASQIRLMTNSSDGDGSCRNLRARLIKKGSDEEVELDLSAIKANKRRRRSSRFSSPMSRGTKSSGRKNGTKSSKTSGSAVKEINSFTE